MYMYMYMYTHYKFIDTRLHKAYFDYYNTKIKF